MSNMRMSCSKTVAQGKGTGMSTRINQRTGNLITRKKVRNMMKGQYITSTEHGKPELIEVPMKEVHAIRVPILKKNGMRGFREVYRGLMNGIAYERDHFLKGMGLGMPAYWVKVEAA